MLKQMGRVWNKYFGSTALTNNTDSEAESRSNIPALFLRNMHKNILHYGQTLRHRYPITKLKYRSTGCHSTASLLIGNIS
jgi:hypothetical protein